MNFFLVSSVLLSLLFALRDVLVSSTFIATLLGVCIAFGIRSSALCYEHHKTRVRVKHDLRDELRDCATRLGEDQVKRIEPITLYLWQLAVHSGDARFLSPKERKEIARWYFVLGNYNYMAERVARLGDDYRQSICQPDEGSKKAVWDARSQEIDQTESTLAQEIMKFVNRNDFWSEDC